MSLSVYTLKDISASQERLCHLLSKNYKSACAICWENIILHSHPEIEISFKFIPKILMSKEYIHFWATLYIYIYIYICRHFVASVCTWCPRGPKFYFRFISPLMREKLSVLYSGLQDKYWDNLPKIFRKPFSFYDSCSSHLCYADDTAMFNKISLCIMKPNILLKFSVPLHVAGLTFRHHASCT